MLSSREDAEDVLQEVFAAAYNAMLGDDRAINVRPWLYRIARNRCLNHLRRPVPVGQDSMDIFERDGGASTSDTVHRREEFRQIVADVHELPETQRTALLLREIDALSYDQIAEAMETTVPSVKSLLVRARVSLAEAAEARLLTCEEVRTELGQAAEGLGRTTAPVRRHLRTCERCRTFRGELRKTTRALAAIYPLGPLIVLKKLAFGKLLMGGGGSAATGAAGTTAGAGAVGGASALGGGALGSGAAMGGASLASTAAATGAAFGGGGIASAVAGTVASKAAATVAAAAIVAAGAVEVKHAAQPLAKPTPVVATVQAPVAKAPPISKPQPVTIATDPAPATDAKTDTTTVATVTPAVVPTDQVPTTTTPAPAVQEGSGTTALPPAHHETFNGGQSAPEAQYGQQTPPPGEPATMPPAPQPAPAAGEPRSGTPPPHQPTPAPPSPPPGG
jgi:RNA polymerase sigma factor (sigma-70 family)